VRSGEPVVHKRYRDAFADTDRDEVLEGLEAARPVVAGAQGDHCIRITTQSAAVRGYDVARHAGGDTGTPEIVAVRGGISGVPWLGVAPGSGAGGAVRPARRV
jgi:hypothetical protein